MTNHSWAYISTIAEIPDISPKITASRPQRFEVYASVIAAQIAAVP